MPDRFTDSLFRRDGLAQLVGQNESRLVLAIQIARELERANAFRAVGEDRDSEKIIADRALAVVEDRPGRDAELMIAAAAFPDRTRRVGMDLEAATTRAIGLAVIVGPADAPKRGAGFLVAMRATALSESVLAAAERRKCWATSHHI